jgi:hypothetical protein
LCHSRITHEDARLRIDQARKKNSLLCLSEDDLLAPYHKKERENHDALCRVLKKHFGIALSLNDFCIPHKHGDDILYTITPLNCIAIGERNQLMVLTCAYGMSERTSDAPLSFELAPETVEFHMIEAR